ncbi:MAG: hypothetical protein JG769_10 [Oscillospiraceae bacterium]|jgi:hypothetical protein|nr:hypothetical protein [Oscillospiraceae bacterium]
METNSKGKLNKAAIIILGLAIIVIAVSVIFNNYNNQGQGNKSEKVIEENVKFGQYDNDRTVPFQIKNGSKISLTVKTDISKGEFLFSILTPDKKIVYEKEGINISDKSELEVYEGTWYYRIKCRNAENGSYSVLGKLNK